MAAVISLNTCPRAYAAFRDMGSCGGCGETSADRTSGVCSPQDSNATSPILTFAEFCFNDVLSECSPYKKLKRKIIVPLPQKIITRRLKRNAKGCNILCTAEARLKCMHWLAVAVQCRGGIMIIRFNSLFISLLNAD
jgi:hypothetical protein